MIAKDGKLHRRTGAGTRLLEGPGRYGCRPVLTVGPQGVLARSRFDTEALYVGVLDGATKLPG